LNTHSGNTYPGIEGSLFLTAPQIFLTGSCAADGVAIRDMTVPANVAGRTVYLQGVVGQGTPSAAFTTVTSASF